MSWLPFYNSWVIFVALVSAFLWELLGVGVFVFLGALAIGCVCKEVLTCADRYVTAFWLFIFSEVAAFGTLFTVCLWSSCADVGGVSDCLELPLLGCFLLIGSSISASAYHVSVGTPLGLVFLFTTMLLGASFVGLQAWEFYDCECDLLNSVYHSACFCTVGLHFTHVVMGLVGLLVILFIGPMVVSLHYVNIVVWYWHFVDYVWIFVFTLVYAA